MKRKKLANIQLILYIPVYTPQFIYILLPPPKYTFSQQCLYFLLSWYISIYVPLRFKLLYTCMKTGKASRPPKSLKYKNFQQNKNKKKETLKEYRSKGRKRS